MPVTFIGAPTVTSGFNTGTPASVNVTNTGTTTLSLFAVPSGGGSPILVGEAVISGNINNGPVSIPYNSSALPAGNYTFYVTGVRPNGQTLTGATSPVVNLPVCFLAGTMIRTPAGDVAVETLRPGDLVLTADGRAEPVVFLGRQTVSSRFGLAETRDPILVQAGALGENLPARDLRVSPHHALVIDGVLCFAQALVNGTTIRQVAAPTETFDYYSVELTRHEVILAEGQPVESFADHVPRERFSNHAEFVALFPNGREVGEMDLPHAKSRRQVPAAIVARIEARTRVIGAAPDQAAA